MRRFILAGLTVFSAVMAWADALPFAVDDIFGEHMVLQRGRPIRISGTAPYAAAVSVAFAGEERSAKADENGRWSVEFAAREAGGPFQFVVRCVPNAEIVIDDVKVGEVWICSGQSNMEYFIWRMNAPFYSLPEGEELLRRADDSDLRLFYVPHAHQPDGPAACFGARNLRWLPADNADALRQFSAVGYYFAKELRRRLGVPVGVIDASWGGSMIQPWIPRRAFDEAGMKEVTDELDRMTLPAARKPSSPEEAQRRLAEQQKALEDWVNLKFLKNSPKLSDEALANWAKPDLPADGWTTAPRAKTKIIGRPGVQWIRLAAELPASWAGAECSLNADFFNDCDQTFFDGVKIGETSVNVPQYWAAPRNYRFKPTSGGRHVFAVRLMTHFGPAYVGERVWAENCATGEKLDLAAVPWSVRTEFVADKNWVGVRPPPPDGNAFNRQTFEFPTALYNAMVAPATAMNIGGAIWYQGCSNSHQSDLYAQLQRMLIDGWRTVFRDAEMPFLICQLSALSVHTPTERLPDDFWRAETPEDNVGWAPMRLVQDSLRNDPMVGIACTVDIGDHSDIHPSNKKEVARRLALEAMRLKFGDRSLRPAPRFQSMRRVGGALEITVSNPGDGLEVRGGVVSPHLFSVAGANGEFVWAKASVDPSGKIMVGAESVSDPVAVRYCHQQYPPDVNIHRKGDGLPLYPFCETLPEAKK